MNELVAALTASMDTWSPEQWTHVGVCAEGNMVKVVAIAVDPNDEETTWNFLGCVTQDLQELAPQFGYWVVNHRGNCLPTDNGRLEVVCEVEKV